MMQDETMIRLFPNLKRGWSLSGMQAKVPISGHNAQQVLSCALDLASGKAVTVIHSRMNSAGFCELLEKIRSIYKRRPVWMLVDNGSLHTSALSKRSAASYKIDLIMLPRQCPELNVVDHLWRSVKSDVSSNHQYGSATEHAEAACDYLNRITPGERLRRAGVYAPNFWLKKIL